MLMEESHGIDTCNEAEEGLLELCANNHHCEYLLYDKGITPGHLHGCIPLHMINFVMTRRDQWQ